MRDSLLRGVVTGTLHRAALSRAPRDNAAAIAVAQIARQVEAARVLLPQDTYVFAGTVRENLATSQRIRTMGLCGGR